MSDKAKMAAEPRKGHDVVSVETVMDKVLGESLYIRCTCGTTLHKPLSRGPYEIEHEVTKHAWYDWQKARGWTVADTKLKLAWDAAE